MIKKISSVVLGLMFVAQVALAGPVIIDIKPKEISKDPVVRDYAAALWEGFKDDPEFIPMVSVEGMPRIVVQIDAETIPVADDEEPRQFVYGVVLSVDWEGNNAPIFMTHSVGVGDKNKVDELGKEQAEQIKEALREMRGLMQYLQQF